MQLCYIDLGIIRIILEGKSEMWGIMNKELPGGKSELIKYIKDLVDVRQ